MTLHAESVSPFGMTRDALSNEAIDRAGELVMNGHGFRSLRRHVLEQMPEPESRDGFLEQSLTWLGNQLGEAGRAVGAFFEWLFSGNEDSASVRRQASSATQSYARSDEAGLNVEAILTTLVIGLSVVLLMVIAAMLVKSLQRRTRSLLPSLSESEEDIRITPAAPPGEQAVSAFESRALKLAAGGDHRAAVRELLLGSMSWVERAGLIRYRQGLTNRDYLRALGRRPDKRRAFAVTALQFEYLYFGRRQPTSDVFDECLRSFQEAFRAEETPVAGD